MGPRSADRGKSSWSATSWSRRFWASMGPRSADRGKVASTLLGSVVTSLQWGRGQLTAERRATVAAVTSL